MIIRVAVAPGEIRAVACDEAGLLDLAIERPGSRDGMGDLHRGRVVARVPALAGSFVRLGEGSEGFLPDSAGGRAGEGTVLAVRVTRAAQGGKGPRLAVVPDAKPGTGPPALLCRGPGAAARLAALHPAAPVLVDDAGHAAALRAALGARVRVVTRAFDADTEQAVAALAEPDAELPGGLRLSVHPTPALTALDVDIAAGADRHGRGKAAAHLAANRAAIPALVRQIRLRNLAGAILVDFAGLSPPRRAALGPALAAALAADPLAPRLLGFTALGLAEILRPRGHPPLHDLLAGPLTAGLAALRAADREAAARPHARLVLAGAPAVIAALERDAAGLAAWRARCGRALGLRRVVDAAHHAWTIEEAADA